MAVEWWFTILVDPIQRAEEICASVGFHLADASLRGRLSLLATSSDTLGDAERMAGYAEAIFRHYVERRPTEVFDEVERRTVILGCLLSDVGKTGPAHAMPDEQRLIVEMFSVEGVPDDTVSVARFLESSFPDDAEARIARFRALELDPEMSIRAFWNLHSGWTLAILETAGVPPEAVAAAATHHLLDSVNPDSIVRDDDRFSRDFGQNKTFDRAEKLIILLDKYDAVRRRAKGSHAQAVAWLKDRIARSPRGRGDTEISALLEVLDEVLGEPAAG